MRFAIIVSLLGVAATPSRTTKPTSHPADWLIDPTPYRAAVSLGAEGRELVLSNGLCRRVIRLSPDAATTSLLDLGTGEEMVRAVGPEARVTIDHVEYAVGGLGGQPVSNFLRPAWISDLKPVPGAYRFARWREEPLRARFPWKKHAEWLSRDRPWPPPGRHVVLTFDAPARPVPLPAVEIHYEIYDGVPLLAKWMTIRNVATTAVTVDAFVAEELRLVEPDSTVDAHEGSFERPNLHVETDYAFDGSQPIQAGKAVFFGPDPEYRTQVNYEFRAPTVLLKTRPPHGPGVVLPAEQELETFRTYELLLDSTDRERRGLALRRMYRTIAPWTGENPLLFHAQAATPEAVRRAIDQAAAVGFEMVIMTFGSRFDFENRDPAYLATYQQLAAEARARGVVLGGYSLWASRDAPDKKDNCQAVCRFGKAPCLGSSYGQWYLQHLRHMLEDGGLGVLEHDGSYPGDRCASANHPGHRGLEDSQWQQWRAITDFYKWCREHGVYLNIPDWYLLSGGSKTVMGYRETNWSLPRAEQEIIERQNIYDGTWEKSPSMGWMFVPLMQYHGGGAAATIEPLHDHVDHYRTRLANLLGAGVQACWRGPRLFDGDETRELVAEWVDFYKAHRQVLDGDLIHLRRADGRDWDGWLHVDPAGKERALAFLYNPLEEEIVRDVTLPLYYSGLEGRARVAVNGSAAGVVTLGPTGATKMTVKIPPRSHTWLLFTRPET